MSLGLTGEGLRCKTLSHKNPPESPLRKGGSQFRLSPLRRGVGGGSWDTVQGL